MHLAHVQCRCSHTVRMDHMSCRVQAISLRGLPLPACLLSLSQLPANFDLACHQLLSLRGAPGHTHTCESMRATTERAHARTLGSLMDGSIRSDEISDRRLLVHALSLPGLPVPVPAFSLVQTDGSRSVCGHGERERSLLGWPCM